MKNHFRGNRFWILALLVALLAGGCATAPIRPVPVVMSAAQRVAHNGEVFDRAWDLVNRKFFDAKFRGVDWPAMREKYRPKAVEAADDDTLYAVMNKMLGELKESHNFALTPERKFEAHAKQRMRVGLSFQRIEEKWAVTEVLVGSPAEAAGVRRGWLVVGRNGQPFDGSPFPLKLGQTVTYDFLDEHDQPRALTLGPQEVSIAFLPETRSLAEGILYLRFDQFDFRSMRWLSEQLKVNRNAPAVVIDLRHNPGGRLVSLDFVLGEFFPKAMPFGTFVRRSGSENEAETLQLFSARYTGKVVLLVGKSSASCSEIFAHAMRYHQRALLVGRKTAGAVILSRFHALPGGGELQLAVADYRGLDGQRLEGAGVTPDVIVPLNLADLRAGVDTELEVALDRLRQPALAAR